MSKEMAVQYKLGKEFWKYEPGTVVQDVPISDPSLWPQIAQWKPMPWMERIAELRKDFDPAKLGTIIYCRLCRKIEDGSHRIVAAFSKGINRFDVEIRECCYKQNLPPGLFYNVLKRGDDYDWLNACAYEKWLKIRKMGLVKFTDYEVLDVGCNVGYSIFEAWNKGATKAIGIDVREDIIEAAEKMRLWFRIDNCVSFIAKDFRKYQPKGIFDAVICMGLLHYFKRDEYEAIVRRLAMLSRKYLIFEMRVVSVDGISFKKVPSGQTVPTVRWLNSFLKDQGFTIKHRVPTRPEWREIWILERMK